MGLGVVIESFLLGATVASTSDIEDTVDQLLLGKRNELTRFDGPCTFESASGRKSPTRATVTLILGRSDSTQLDPVDTSLPVGNGQVRLKLNWLLILKGPLLQTEHLLVLLFSTVGEHIVAEDVA